MPSDLLSLDDAVQKTVALFQPIPGTELRPLHTCVGRTLAEPLITHLNIPGFRAAAMDGYAVAGTPSDTLMPVATRITAGGGIPSALMANTAARIFTGAPVPEGADRVIAQEDAIVEGDQVRFTDTGRAGRHIRAIGEDVSAGTQLFAAGHRLRVTDLAPLAAQGIIEAPVKPGIRIALLASGDELTEPGAPLTPGHIYESNRLTLAVLMQRWGAQITLSRCVPDDPDVIATALNHAAQTADLIITSGGMSVGEEDHMRAVIESNGRVDFWRVKVKPGKPVAVGHVFDTPVLGLPGNPVSGVVMALLFGKPILAALGGSVFKPLMRIPLPAQFTHTKKTPRREFLRAALQMNKHGIANGVALTSGQGSAQIRALSAADGLIDLPGAGEEGHRDTVAPGDTVHFIPFFGAMG